MEEERGRAGPEQSVAMCAGIYGTTHNEWVPLPGQNEAVCRSLLIGRAPVEGHYFVL